MPQAVPPSSSLVHFGVFELDRESGDLRKNGRKVKIDHQPLQVLELLLDRPGRVVSREELQLKLWPSDTFVDFEHGINSTIKRLRQTLDDSAETARFIETLPRRGYRFICPVRNEAGAHEHPGRASRRWIAGIALFAGITAALVVLGVNVRRSGPRVSGIAVLPFNNLTGEPQNEYLVDGIHDDVITALAEISALKVISRTSVMRYRKSSKPLREIAAELHVDGILEGAMRRNGERWHVSAQLISARDDQHVWAQSFDSAFREVATVPRQIARGVATRLQVPLLPGEAARLATAEAVDPALYEVLTKAKHHSAKWTKDGLQKAVRYFQEAIDIDPTCAAAWNGLGTAYEGLSDWGSRADDEAEPDRQLRRQAEAALRRAVELDSTLRGPHQALGRMKLAEWKWEEGAVEFERAHELDPGHPGFPVYLLERGKFDEAVEAQQKNAELDPLAYNSQLSVGFTAFMAGRYEKGIEALKRTIDLNPDVPHAHYELAWCYAKKAMYKEAISQCDTALALLRKKEQGAFVAGSCEWVYALAGRRREALELARRIEAEGNGRRHVRVAHVYDALGDRERALEYLQKAYDQHAGSLPRQWHNPMLSEEIKADPRFQDLIRRTGHPWAAFPAARHEPAATNNTRVKGQP